MRPRSGARLETGTLRVEIFRVGEHGPSRQLEFVVLPSFSCPGFDLSWSLLDIAFDNNKRITDNFRRCHFYAAFRKIEDKMGVHIYSKSGPGAPKRMSEWTDDEDWSLDSESLTGKEARFCGLCIRARQALRRAASYSKSVVTEASAKLISRFVPETRKAFRRCY